MSDPSLTFDRFTSLEFRKFISRYFDNYCKDKKEVSILCLGTLYIDEYLSEWMKQQSIKKDITILFHVMREKTIARKFNKPGYYPKPAIFSEIKAYKEKHNEMVLGKFPIEQVLGKFSIDEELELTREYDIIINLYVLHNALNWRLFIIRLFRHLKDKGLFMFSEAGGTYAVVDGNFKNFPDKKADGLKRFDERRNEENHFWRPELSLTNYTVLKTQVEFLFDQVIDKESVDKNSNEWEKGIIPAIDLNPDFTFKRLIEDRVFSYFWKGIPEESTQAIIQTINSDGSLDVDCSNLNRQDQIYLCSSFNRQRFQALKERHWNYNTLLKDIDHIKDNSIATLGRKAIDILTSHDIFLPGYTKYIALISWASDVATDWSYPIHLVAENNSFKDHMTDHLQFLNDSHLMLLKLLFKDSVQKYPIYVSVRDSVDFQSPSLYEYTLTGDGKIRIAYHLEKTRKDKIEQLKLVVSTELVREILLKGEEQLAYVKEPKKHPTSSGQPIKKDIEVKLKDENLVRFQIHQEVPANLTTIDKISELCKLAIKDEKITFLANTLKNLFFGDNEDKNNVKDSVLEWFLTLTILFQLREPGDSIGYIPSSIILETKDKENISGLGGLIIFENRNGEMDDLLKGLFLARDKALEEAVNLIFYKASIASHVNRDFRFNALQFAGAAISARSGSHTLGSHVLPEVIGRLGNLIQKAGDLSTDPLETLKDLLKTFDKAKIKDLDEPGNGINIFCQKVSSLQTNTKYLFNESELFKYLQERLDFITQIIGDHPQWSLSMNYISDLLRNFYQQNHILNSLGDTEGLTAYAYPQEPGKKVSANREENWFEDNNISLIKEGDTITLYSHCVPVDGVLVFVNSKTEATALLKQPSIISNPEFPVFICEDYRNSPKNTPFDLIQKGNIEASFYGQKIKISGRVKTVVSRNKIILSNCKISGNKLVLKTRVRKYLFLNNDYSLRDTSDYSKVLSRKKMPSFLNIGNKHIADNMANVTSTGFAIFLGVIESIKFQEAENVYRVNLFSSKNLNFYFNISAEIYTKINNIREDRKEFKLKKNILCVGARVILLGELKNTKEGSNVYKIINDEGTDYPVIQEISYIEYLTTTSSVQEDNRFTFKDIQVAIPGGTVGTQAFYIILENIIRNAAKHNWIQLPDYYKVGKNLEVKIELEDHQNQDYYICKIWTNTTNLEYENAIPFNGDPMPDFLNHPQNLTNQINFSLKDSIIKEDGTLKRYNLGLSEIKICAAFLAKHNWIENGILHGDKVILDDKDGAPSEGFIKCSMILEEDAGELVPRLGYRIKLLKPVGIIIAGGPPNTFPGETGIGITNSASDVLKSVDYQFCVLYPDEKQNNFAWQVLKLIDGALAKKISGKKLDEEINELSRKIEYYPCRLFVVTEKAKPGEWNKFFLTSTASENDLSQRLFFFRKRICFVTPDDINDHSAKGAPEFKDFLYKRWYRMFTSKEHNYNLQIEPGDINFVTSNHPSVTVPINLRPPNEGSINNHLTKTNECFIDRKKEITYVIKYSRHANSKKQNKSYPNHHVLYREGITGASRIYGLIRDYNRAVASDNRESVDNTNSLSAKLIETGLCNIMILDERIMNFVHNKDDNRHTITSIDLYNVFQHLNIIVPYKVEINDKTLYETDLNLDAVDGNPKKIELGFENNNDKSATIYFKQPSNTSLPEEYRINSMVIHQTILDHISKGIHPAPHSNAVSIRAVDNVILQLKHEKNIPCIIITSGRGRSSNSSDYAKFMPFSNISHLLLRKDPDKYTLTQILLQSLNLPTDGK